MAVFLTQSSPGLRTSAVKRGYWVVRRVLGEVIPPPPPVVPELPQDEAKIGCSFARCAGAASLESGLRRMPCPVRHVRSGHGRLRTGRREAQQRPGRPASGYCRPRSRAVMRVRDSAACRRTSERSGRTITSTISAASCCLMRLGRTLLLSDEPVVEKMKADWRLMGIASIPWWRRSYRARSS